MGEAVGPAGFDDGHVVDAAGDLGKPIADPDAGLAELLELSLAGEKWRAGGDAHRRFRAREAGGERLAGELGECGLGVEEVEVTWSAVEEAPDHGLRFGGELRWLGGERIERQCIGERGVGRRGGAED